MMHESNQSISVNHTPGMGQWLSQHRISLAFSIYQVGKLFFVGSNADAIVMPPGPMNRGIEISDEVADGPQSVILEQVETGVLICQALIHQILS